MRAAYTDWVKGLRGYGRGILLQPNMDLDGDLLGARLPRRRPSAVPGRGFAVDRGTASLVQVAL